MTGKVPIMQMEDTMLNFVKRAFEFFVDAISNQPHPMIWAF